MELLRAAYVELLATSGLELVAVIFGVLYIVFAARQSLWCWPAAFIGTASSVYLFWDGRLLMESALNVYYLLMAIYGWYQWRYGSVRKDVLSVRSFSLTEHLITILVIVVLALVSGYFLDKNTNAALPYLDSFTTWAAVITTWMVAKKVLQNWLYWIVINSASIYLYLERGFALYALLFAVYIVIAIIAYRQWRHSWRYDRPS